MHLATSKSGRLLQALSIHAFQRFPTLSSRLLESRYPKDIKWKTNCKSVNNEGSTCNTKVVQKVDVMDMNSVHARLWPIGMDAMHASFLHI